jgi:hypothetical protein
MDHGPCQSNNSGWIKTKNSYCSVLLQIHQLWIPYGDSRNSSTHNPSPRLLFQRENQLIAGAAKHRSNATHQHNTNGGANPNPSTAAARPASHAPCNCPVFYFLTQPPIKRQRAHHATPARQPTKPDRPWIPKEREAAASESPGNASRVPAFTLRFQGSPPAYQPCPPCRI